MRPRTGQFQKSQQMRSYHTIEFDWEIEIAYISKIEV